MRFSVLSLFPEQVENFLKTSMIGRAMEKKIIELESVQIRDFAENRYGQVDDTLFGGGMGMLMMCEPIYRAWKSIEKKEKSHTVFFSPKGTVFTQQKAIDLSKKEHLIFICGHYEGVDQRVLDEIVDEEISLGDYVLTGGEIAACTIIDSVSRMVEGVLPDKRAYEEESHMTGLLEAPQYTRPEIWRDRAVPPVLLTGHHENIRKWRKNMALRDTMRLRPDLFEKINCTEEEWLFLLSELHGGIV